MKKVLTYTTIVLMMLAFCVGLWSNRGHHMDSVTLSFNGMKFPQFRPGFEAEWRKTHPNAKKVSFAYYIDFNDVSGCWVNYYY